MCHSLTVVSDLLSATHSVSAPPWEEIDLCQSGSYTGNDKVPEQIMQIKSQRQPRAYLFTFEVIWSLSSATAAVLLSKLQASVAVF